MTKNIIIKTSVQKRFDNFMVHGRVLFFSAPCGFGKTVLADALLRGRNVLRQSAADPDCAIPPSEQDWDILLIDDLQLMQEEAGQQALCELIRSSPERRFVLLSRGVPPGCLTAFQYTGLMTVLEADDLLFDAGDVRRLFQLSGVNVTDSEIDGILKESMGYPLGVAITARCMSPNKPWTPELVARAVAAEGLVDEDDLVILNQVDHMDRPSSLDACHDFARALGREVLAGSIRSGALVHLG